MQKTFLAYCTLDKQDLPSRAYGRTLRHRAALTGIPLHLLDFIRGGELNENQF